jgi:hypothetical protein
MKACAYCRQERLLVALHGNRGGPDVCIECSGSILARARRNQRRESLMWKGFGDLDPRYAPPGDLDTELLRDILALTHPDRHPDRRELATRVTARLTALQPYILPPKPPEPKRDAKVGRDRVATREPVTDLLGDYPCKTCRELLPRLYCDACRARYDENLERESRHEREKRRQRERARRARRRLKHRRCETCRGYFKSPRRDARYCSAACRQKAYRDRQRADELEEAPAA